MDRVKDHFEDEAQDFDRVIRALIPHYSTMMRALVEAIPFEKDLPLRVVDLGCGTGMAAGLILEIFPNAQVTCLDIAENMIASARSRLSRFLSVKYVVADFQTYTFIEKYDVIVSSLASHHLVTNEDKKQFYLRIFEALNPGGVFYNAEIVLASNDFMQSVNMNAWRSFMRQNISNDEIEGRWIPKYQEEDRPAKLIDQLAWLTEIGFVDVDVIWKYYNFAVFGGVRPYHCNGTRKG
jgi:tRNA (cmo5U34)-methyltransferase